jgi:predicted nucleotidyltransferase
MDRSTVIARLREHQPELRAAGIVRLSLFGSLARGERGDDVDLMAEFDASRRFSALEMVGLQNRLSDILDAPVDLAPAKSLHDGIREQATRETVPAF